MHFDEEKQQTLILDRGLAFMKEGYRNMTCSISPPRSMGASKISIICQEARREWQVLYNKDGESPLSTSASLSKETLCGDVDLAMPPLSPHLGPEVHSFFF